MWLKIRLKKLAQNVWYKIWQKYFVNNLGNRLSLKKWQKNVV